MSQTDRSLTEAFTEYQEVFLPAKNLAASTRRFYRDDITQLLAYLESRQITTTGQLELKYLNGFLADLDRRNLSGYTRRRKAASVRSFLGFLEESGYTSTTLSKKLIPPRREYSQPRVLSEAEYKRLQLAVRNQPMYAAIIEIFLQTGIRLSELANLLISDIELPAKISKEADHAGSVFIRKGKGRKDRMIALNYKACQAVKAWLQVRPTDVATQALFLSKFKRQITHRGIEWIVNKCLNEAKIERAHVHSLRHTFGTHAVKKGMNLRTVKEMMGHSSLAATDIYIGLAREQMNREVQEFSL